jgi:predicted nicotinamide N-methyase
MGSELARAFLTEETVPLRDGRDVSILRPRDSEELLEEEAFEHEELLPYWAELWPSAIGLAQAIAGRSLRGARTVELGCGLGLVSIAAAMAGGRVLATDWSAESIRFTRSNATRNEVELETAIVDWAEPQLLLERAPWQLVLGSDILYERRMVDQMLDLLPRLVEPEGEVWIGDPGRLHSVAFLERAEEEWERRTTMHGKVEVHRLRRRSRS